MKRLLKDRGVVVTAFLVSVVLVSSCQKAVLSKSPGAPLIDPAPRITALPVMPWKLSYSSEGSMSFSMDSNGTYEIAMTSSDQVFSGELAKDDLDSLSTEFDSVCSDGAKDHAVAQLARGGREALLCSRSLAERLRILTDKYVPRPFPNPCIGAVGALEKLHEEVRRCERDDECSWIAPGYLPIDDQELSKGKHPERDECGWMRPLLVANAFETVVSQQSLVLARAVAEDVCHESPLKRPGCWKKNADDASLGSLACVHGRCQQFQGGTHQ